MYAYFGIRHSLPRSKSFPRCQNVLGCDGPDTEDSPPSPTSSDSSIDDEEVNKRIQPFWPKYQALFKAQGFRLDTVKDVKAFYGLQVWQVCLPDNLFRGTRIVDSTRFVAKAVHACSRELDIISTLCRPPLRDDPMNHTIPVLDLFKSDKDDIAFIVMEEWSSQLVTDASTCCLTQFLSALRQCIEHTTFMHGQHFAHLDISLRNLLTDYKGHYAYIDYELSRRISPCSSMAPPMVYNYRGTEVPPECEKAPGVDPYKVDVWALAVLILRACKLTGYWVPELMDILQPMLEEDPGRRPSSSCVLQAFDRLMISLGHQLAPNCADLH